MPARSAEQTTVDVLVIRSKVKVTADISTNFTTFKAFIFYTKVMLLNMKMQIWQMNIIISQSLQTEFCVSSTYLIMHVSKYMILVLCRAIPDKVRFLVYFAYVF